MTFCAMWIMGSKNCVTAVARSPLRSPMRRGARQESFSAIKQDRRVPVEVRVQPLLSADGNVVGGIEVFSDDPAQAEARRKIEEMKRMAFLDHLTQLPNRRFIEIPLHTALSEFHEHRSPFGVLFIGELLSILARRC